MMKLHDPVPGYANDLHESMGGSGLWTTEDLAQSEEGTLQSWETNIAMENHHFSWENPL